MRFSTILLALALYVACAMAQQKTPLQVISESTDHFSTNFFKSVAVEQNGNLISSPLSAHIVLSMAAYGARTNTAMQMRSALGLPADDNVGRQGFQNLIDELNNVKNVTLEVANKIYVTKELPLNPQFQQLSSEYFRSEVAPLDLGNPTAAANDVNGWVKEKTHNKIKDIVDSSDITADLRMIFLNAVYFKGNWAKAFSKNKTENKPFYYVQNQERKEKLVPTMHSNANYFYGELPDLKARFVELPYENKDFKMVIIVPDEVDGLKDVEQNLQAFNYSRLAKSGSEREINLFLPKFKIESLIDLKSTLEKLGMGEMFTNRADFSGIANAALNVDKVLQKAFIEVNEEGSEAAAVTAVRFTNYSLQWSPPEEPTVKVDRPFAFAIIDSRNEITFFTGHYTYPELNE